MTTIVLDEKTASTPIGEVIHTATDSIIEFRDPSGELLAKLVVGRQQNDPGYRPLLDAAEAEIHELRRRRTADRASDVTTAQLLARVGASKRE